MMKKLYAALLAGLLFLGHQLNAASTLEEVHWFTDLAQATRLADSSGKPLLTAFR
jgi:hypothetical protein